MSEPSICILFALTGSCSRSSCTCLHEEVKPEIKKLCPFFNTKTGCKKGALCLYQHKLLEYKSKKACKYFITGKCKYDDDKCPYTHYLKSVQCLCKQVAEDIENNIISMTHTRCYVLKHDCICQNTYIRHYGENAASQEEIFLSKYCKAHIHKCLCFAACYFVYSYSSIVCKALEHYEV